MTKLDNDVLMRMQEEYKGLVDRIDKLEAMLKSFRAGENPFTDLSEIHLLEEQLHYMRGYRKILRIRLHQQNVLV